MRQVYYLTHEIARGNAVEAVRSAPEGYVVEIRPKTRSVPQNSRMWAILSEISKQVVWHGRKLSENDWKNIFMATIRKQIAVPNLDNNGFVVLGGSSSKLTVDEMTELQELMMAFAVEHGVKIND